MPWNLRLIPWVDGLTHNDLVPGDCFFFDPTWPSTDGNYWVHHNVEHLSEQYHRDNHWRLPLVVTMVSRTLFCVDSQCWSDRAYYGGWTVHGEPPFITVSPSINIGGVYHGFIVNGVLGDDVDGRKFDPQGKRL